MRLSYINVLSEDIEKKRPYLKKKLEDAIAPQTFFDVNEVINDISNADPIAVRTKGKKTPFVDKITDWCIAQKIQLPEDAETVRDVLTKYNDLYHHGKLKKKIDDYESPGDLRADIEDVSDVENEDIYSDYVELVDQIPGFKMYRVDTFEQGEIVFKDSGWCVQHEEQFDDYGPPYFMVVTDKNKRYALMHQDFYQIKDVHDRPLTLELAKPIEKFIKKIWDEFSFAGDLIYLAKLWPDEEAMDVIKSHPSTARDYAIEVIKGRWLEAEPIIMKSPPNAYTYAFHIIKGRWPEAEPYIMRDPVNALNYAVGIIKGRWPEAEPYIMKDPEVAYKYAYEVIKGRWPEAEPYIMKDIKSIFGYANTVIKDRWLEAEPIIMKDPDSQLAENYKFFVINKGKRVKNAS